MNGKCYEVLKNYKYMKDDILHLVPIYCEETIIGYLRPITADFMIAMPNIVSTLSRWRRDNPMAGTGSFEVTDARTQNWVEKFVLKNEKRIIFLIQDLEFRYIGHIGLAEIDTEQNSADIDAVLRGERGISKGIMTYALQAIINWCKIKLGIRNIFLDVFSDNPHAIKFYEKNNFIEVKRIALEQICYENEIKWEINETMNPNEAERCYIRMELV